MANWNKIAEAFGRALSRPDIRNEMNVFGKNSKQGIRDRRDLFDLVEKKARDNNAEDELYHGMMGGEDDNTILWREKYEVENKDPSYDERQKDFDDRTDQREATALQQDFDDGFEEALNKRRGKIRDAMGDARGAEEAADAGIDDIRKVVIEMLKSGQDIGDVIRILKGE